jgi:hypothetical protein
LGEHSHDELEFGNKVRDDEMSDKDKKFGHKKEKCAHRESLGRPLRILDVY